MKDRDNRITASDLQNDCRSTHEVRDVLNDNWDTRNRPEDISPDMGRITTFDHNYDYDGLKILITVMVMVTKL